MAAKTFEQVLDEVRGKPILVANRGIPARRICRAIRERFAAVPVMTATDIDKAAPAASSAQELLLLGSDPRAYLDLDLIIAKAKQRGIIAIHPGWGFASEDERFPQKCEEAGITFIGSKADSMNLLGNKVQVRKIAKRLGIPVVPGSEGAVDVPAARKVVDEITLPIMLKAEGGGGGRGIFLVREKSELEDAFFKASAMAQASFGNPRLYVEKYLEQVRHIEIQVIADQHGNVFAFDERDCSVQRNHQKLVEITPSPWAGITPELRERLKEYSRMLVREVGYYSLATVEFLVTPQGEPYLIEVNTRLQVEHGITESRYGVDLVEEQIAVAFGAKLRLTEENTKPSHFAMQVRINCEDPQNNFAPNSGLITRYVSPGGPGVRIDTGVEQGDTISPKFDSMMGKVIVTAQNRLDAVARVRRVLDELVIEGVPTPIPLFKEIFRNDDFTAEHGHPFAVSTKWLERTYLNRTPASAASGQPASLAAAPGAAAPAAPDKSKSETFVIEMNNRRVKLTVPLDIVENITGSARARGAKRPTQPLRGAGLHNVASSAAAANDGAKSGVIASPMQAVVTRINVSEGQQVAKGDLLVVLESMKMENYVYAPAAGEVKKIFVGPADGVEAGDTLVTLDVNAGKAKAAAAAPGSLPQAAASTAPSSEGADKATDAKKEGGND